MVPTALLGYRYHHGRGGHYGTHGWHSVESGTAIGLPSPTTPT